MSEITLEQFLEITEKRDKTILDAVGRVETQIIQARCEISELLKEHSVLESNFNNHERHQDKEIAEIKVSLDLNWTKTREIELKIIKWAGIATGLSLAGSSIASKFL